MSIKTVMLGRKHARPAAIASIIPFLMLGIALALSEFPRDWAA